MPGASEFVSFTFGNVTASGFVTPEALARIDAGEVVDVILHDVVAVHGDVGEEVPLGDVACTFIGGEPTPFVPGQGRQE
ncbi:hypothetical protein E5F05_11195 [Deinococcus metallilatus]|uniref:Uncharacterized protein n=1 Tax=Deinococcus metallilatus TaxID=1211322 RepID=A0AAJ5JXN0_9DEIO|nr:hypothetical protein [Deinococcus metallilatus]MBB5296515.1 hypothetical protein [Deinococcus metallilatus]QBY08454.1 hypothetical protein E5F05_11195 [Deinococcus metallilatus]RXJ11253.1 hypothetical protein ERJ73_10015 [Deinococcus metallilatus]TLK24744.1 hypothetical protein FCS05_14450 [Deinococcus metallilatus]GMA17432.1 hypothetical protein GCM10025871_37630 [Deinococcus metallilatus]